MKIEHECPQCGAPIILEETDRLLSCNFCRVKLYIQARDYFQYYFPPADNIKEDIFFVPYWRFRGMHFKCITNRIEQGLLDKTFPAVSSQSIPPSLGLRPQTLKPRLVQPSDMRIFLKPQLTFKESYVTTEQKVSEALFYESFIAETLSLLYAPMFIRDVEIYDAILNEPVLKHLYDDGFNLRDAWKDSETVFLPTICPNCGWDMIAERDSCILVCPQCNSLWETSTEGFRTMNFIVMGKAKDNTNLMYLPFWRMKINVRGVDLKSYADLIRYCNLPKSIRKEWEKPGLYFWATAFKVPPAVFLMLSRQLTYLQPDMDTDDDRLGSRVSPANLPRREAMESVKITLADMSVRKKILFPQLNDISVECVESLLVYYPFIETKTEFIHKGLRLGIQKNALKLGQKI